MKSEPPLPQSPWAPAPVSQSYFFLSTMWKPGTGQLMLILELSNLPGTRTISLSKPPPPTGRQTSAPPWRSRCLASLFPPSRSYSSSLWKEDSVSFHWFAWALSDNYRIVIKGASKTRTHCGTTFLTWPCSQTLTRIVTRATFVGETHSVPGQKCLWKSSETFLVSARRATMLPRFATDGKNRRTQSCRHNVPPFC